MSSYAGIVGDYSKTSLSSNDLAGGRAQLGDSVRTRFDDDCRDDDVSLATHSSHYSIRLSRLEQIFENDEGFLEWFADYFISTNPRLVGWLFDVRKRKRSQCDSGVDTEELAIEVASSKSDDGDNLVQVFAWRNRALYLSFVAAFVLIPVVRYLLNRRYDLSTFDDDFVPLYSKSPELEFRILETAAPTVAPTATPMWLVVLQWVAIPVLVCLSGIFSGLTLGVMSLDLIALEILIGGNPDSKEARYARKIKPIRKRGNLLLCTLLLGNTVSNSALSVLLADYTSGVLGVIVSSFVIVIFGEIIPQAVCSRYGLFFGANLLFLVKFFLVLLFVIAYPISLVLDWLLKDEIGNVYNIQELKKLIEIHQRHKKVDMDQAKMIDGALNYRDKYASDVMTPKEDIFMLHVDDTLGFHTMASIFKAGYSRIPVYSGNNRSNIVGLVLTKDLIVIDPEDNTQVSSIVQFFGRQAHYVWPDTPLPDVLLLFRSGQTHMALVQVVNNECEEVDPTYEVVGLVTLEDIIEEILQEEIQDETDAPPKNSESFSSSSSFTPGVVRKQVNSSKTCIRSEFDFALLRLLDSKSYSNDLTDNEKAAIAAHVCTNLSYFKQAIDCGDLTAEQVRSLIDHSNLLHLKSGEVLYKSGELLTHCTLVLSGTLEIVSGSEKFRSFVSQWAFLGQSSLAQENSELRCDFTATVSSDNLRCMRIYRNHFETLLKGEHLDVQVLRKRVKSSPLDEAFGTSTTPDEAPELNETKLSDKGSSCGSPAEEEEEDS